MLGFLRVLAACRGLRGTALDPFGYTQERRVERELIANYEKLLNAISGQLDEVHFSSALELVSLPDGIRGYGPVKRAAVEEASRRYDELLASWPELMEEMQLP